MTGYVGSGRGLGGAPTLIRVRLLVERRPEREKLGERRGGVGEGWGEHRFVSIS